MAAMASLVPPLSLDGSPNRPTTSSDHSLYSPMAPSESSATLVSASSESTLDHGALDSDNDEDSYHIKKRPRTSRTPSPPSIFALPTLPRFLADFTLGFADGLTVPFALTAGLSSLGQTDTVIYAGMAEICAGSISMGIGGYLSAKDESSRCFSGSATAVEGPGELQPQGESQPDGQDDRDLEKTAGGSERMEAEASDGPQSLALGNYLAPLELPPQLLELVVAHVRAQPGIEEALALAARADKRRRKEDADSDDGGSEDERPCSAVVVGLSVAVGYLLGGLLPLFPYFFVSRVGDALQWSFGVCVIALFSFGFSKDFFVTRAERRRQQQQQHDAQWWVAFDRRGNGARVPWRDIQQSAWEGIQMVVLGSVAALAAVLCVRTFEGLSVTSSSET